MIRWIRRKISDFWDRHGLEIVAVLALGVMLLIVLYPFIVYTINPGHVAVHWKRFFGGTQTAPASVRQEGIRAVFPWDRLYVYNARLQRIDETVKGLSIDGLDVTIKVFARFSVDARYVGYLHKAVGENYQDSLIRPALRVLVLKFIAENEAEDLHSNRRERVGSSIQARFKAELTNVITNIDFDDQFILVEDVLIDEIILPEVVRNAIENKESVRHLSESYEFRLTLEDQERERKRIEAEGIRAFQEIIAPGITESYLAWRGIEATLRLAESNNAKVVVIGGDGNGLPIILNTDPGPAAPPGTGQSIGAQPRAGDALQQPMPTPPPLPSIQPRPSGSLDSPRRPTNP